MTDDEQRKIFSKNINKYIEQSGKLQKEIAKEYHISRSYISRIEKRALIKLLKCYLQEKEG